MIGKGIATKGSPQAFDYLLKEEKNAYVLDINLLSGNNGKELLNDMRIIQNLNSKCFKNTFSFVLSAESEDSKKLTPQTLLDIKNDFLDDLSNQFNELNLKKGKITRFELKKHQHIAVVHRNTRTFHTHILLSKIDDKGNAAPDNHIAYKCQSAAQRVGEKYHLINAWDRHNEKKKKKQQDLKEHRKRLYQIYERVLKMKPKNIDQFSKIMLQNNLYVEQSINRQAKLQGYRIIDKSNGLNLKASEIHKNMTLKHLMPILENNVNSKSHSISR